MTEKLDDYIELLSCLDNIALMLSYRGYKFSDDNDDNNHNTHHHTSSPVGERQGWKKIVNPRHFKDIYTLLEHLKRHGALWILEREPNDPLTPSGDKIIVFYFIDEQLKVDVLKIYKAMARKYNCSKMLILHRYEATRYVNKNIEQTNMQYLLHHHRFDPMLVKMVQSDQERASSTTSTSSLPSSVLSSSTTQDTVDGNTLSSNIKTSSSSPQPPTPLVYIQLFLVEKFKYRLLEHQLQPKFEILNTKEKNEILKHYKTPAKFFHAFCKDDPIAEYYDMPIGTCVKVTRRLGNQNPVIVYRIVNPYKIQK